MANVDQMNLADAYDDDVDVDVDVDDTDVCNVIDVRVRGDRDDDSNRGGTGKTAPAGWLDAGDIGGYSTDGEEEEVGRGGGGDEGESDDPRTSLLIEDNDNEAAVAENDGRERDEGVGGMPSSELEGGRPVPQRTSTADAAATTGGEENDDGIVGDRDGRNANDDVVEEVEGGHNVRPVSTRGGGTVPMLSSLNGGDGDEEDPSLRQAGTTTMTATPSSPPVSLGRSSSAAPIPVPTAAAAAAAAAATAMMRQSGVRVPVSVQHELPVWSTRW